jgi:hypothetical protein
MNRRGFLASLVALAVAPAVKAEPVRRVKRLCRFPKYKGLVCPPFRSALDVDLNWLRKQAFGGVAPNSRIPSYGNGGIVLPLRIPK